MRSRPNDPILHIRTYVYGESVRGCTGSHPRAARTADLAGRT
jgi:hypothetical protein